MKHFTGMDLNSWFKDAFRANMLHFRWTSFEVSSIVPYTKISDTKLRGSVVNVSVGRDSAGSFSIRGALYSADGDIALSSSKDTLKCCIGSKPWMLVRFALSRGEEYLDGFDAQYLDMLGFAMKSMEISCFG